jgi:hypothetical protein
MALLPLATWFRLMGFNPWHAHQLAGSSIPVTTGCDTIVYQHAWQNIDALGRAEIIQAIETAEARLRNYLGYSVAPHTVTETLAYPSYLSPAFRRYAQVGSDGAWLTLQLGEGYVQSIGASTLSLVASLPVTASDEDGDGVKEWWTAGGLTTATDPTTLEVYIATADRIHDTATSERWRIQPVDITISGGTATITGYRYLLVKPILYEGVTRRELSATDDANYVTTIELYQRTPSDSSEATLIYDTQPWPWFCGCSATDSSSDPAATGTTTGRAGINDSRRGIIHAAPATLNTDTGIWSGSFSTCRQPDRVTLTYRAGLPLVDGQMDPEWAVVVARLAAAELARPICACQSANREPQRWQTDLARTNAASDETFGAISQDDLANPLGTRRGHVYAWRRINSLALMRGFAL